MNGQFCSMSPTSFSFGIPQLLCGGLGASEGMGAVWGAVLPREVQARHLWRPSRGLVFTFNLSPHVQCRVSENPPFRAWLRWRALGRTAEGKLGRGECGKLITADLPGRCGGSCRGGSPISGSSGSYEHTELRKLQVRAFCGYGGRLGRTLVFSGRYQSSHASKDSCTPLLQTFARVHSEGSRKHLFSSHWSRPTGPSRGTCQLWQRKPYLFHIPAVADNICGGCRLHSLIETVIVKTSTLRHEWGFLAKWGPPEMNACMCTYVSSAMSTGHIDVAEQGKKAGSTPAAAAA